jgi:hypothetical protein
MASSASPKSHFMMFRRKIISFQGHLAYLKHHLSDFFQVAFFNAQDAENEFVWPLDTLKHRFIDFTKVVF